MDWASTVISAVCGGLATALPTYLLTRRKVSAEARQIDAGALRAEIEARQLEQAGDVNLSEKQLDIIDRLQTVIEKLTDRLEKMATAKEAVEEELRTCQRANAELEIKRFALEQRVEAQAHEYSALTREVTFMRDRCNQILGLLQNRSEEGQV